MKRWIGPALGALGLHFLLFATDWGVSRPILMIPDSTAVTISLVETAPVAPAPPKMQPAPPVASTPEKQVIQKPKPEPEAEPTPLPPEPPPEAPPRKAPPSMELPENIVPSIEDQSIASDQVTKLDPANESNEAPADPVRIQASVPLYHLNPPPVYPSVARRRNYEGTTVLAVLVDREGKAAQVKVHESSGFAMLDRSALKTIKRWRFEPARRMGRPVEMWVQVPVRFELE